MKIHISNGRVIDPRSGTDAKQDVYIEAGRISAMGTAPANPPPSGPPPAFSMTMWVGAQPVPGPTQPLSSIADRKA